MSRRIHIPNHLILPFGTARKFDLNRIRLSSVAANGIYFTADVPCIYISRSAKKPSTINDWAVLSADPPLAPDPDDVSAALDFVHGLVAACMPDPTRHEDTFLKIYFSWLKEHLDPRHQFEPLEPFQLYNALLPIPEMQLYVTDPLEEDWSFEPTNNFRVDFGFWTGARLVAVEIDGNEPGGYARDLRRDRLLRRAEIDVIHILNTEIEHHGEKVVTRLMPHTILYDWQNWPTPKYQHFPF